MSEHKKDNIPARDAAGHTFVGRIRRMLGSKPAPAVTPERSPVQADPRDAFMANVIHELRTPLNGIIGMLELIEPSDLAAPKDAYLEEVKRSSATLLALVNDLLDASKIQAGEMSLEKVPFDLPALIDEIGTSHVKAACEKELRLSLVVGEDVPEEVHGDPLRIKQIVTNLLTNAIKFTEQGEVAVEVSVDRMVSDAAHVEFRVTDTGVGFSEEHREKILKPFAQADASTTRMYGGTGLGLPICSRLIEMMGGTLEVQSTPGGGSSFSFVLPLDLFETEGKLESSEMRAKPRRRALSEENMTAARSGVKVLVAEDNEVNRMVVMEHLRLLGYDAHAVHNGQEALQALRPGHGYDVVLMDGQMPVLDGYQATLQLREQEQAFGERRVPVIALTAHAMHHHRSAAINAGMDDYLSKPYTLDDLRNVIELWTSGEAAPEVQSRAG